MGRTQATLVRQMHEALRGEVTRDGVPTLVISALHARIQRLKSRDARFAGVRLSRDMAMLLPLVRSA